jgi:four helix bundle protein
MGQGAGVMGHETATIRNGSGVMESQSRSKDGGMEKDAEGFRKLNVWQKAYELTLEIYRITSAFPKNEMYGLTSQLRRAAASVPANIAEGYERNHRKEYLQFLYIAKGSLGEVETFLLLANDLRYLAKDEHKGIDEKRKIVSRLLKGFIKSLA